MKCLNIFVILAKKLEKYYTKDNSMYSVHCTQFSKIRKRVKKISLKKFFYKTTTGIIQIFQHEIFVKMITFFLQGTNIGDLMIQWVELNSIIRAIFQCGVAFPQILTLPSNMLMEKLTFSREDIFGNLMITACEWSTPCPKELELIGCNVLNQMI